MESPLRHLLGVALLAVAGAASASLPECTPGQLPYNAYFGAGDTAVNAEFFEHPTQACYRWAETNPGYSLASFDAGNCLIQENVSGGKVWAAIRARCEPVDPTALTPSKVQDYMTLWALLLGAGVIILCAKAVYRPFRIDRVES